jgi:pilus assembly protein Flp/PilA
MRLQRKFLAAWQRFRRDDDGPTAVEYAVMLALITVVCIATVNTLATNLRQNFDRSSEAIESAGN